MRKLGLLPLLFFASYTVPSQDLDLPKHFQALVTNHPQQVIFRGHDTTKTLTLTFDDGPSEITPALLDLLDKYNTKATFFWQGKNLITHPEIVKRAFTAGHEVGNHSWDHPNCFEMSPEELWNDQIQPTFTLYDSLFNIQPKIYRPPFGGINEDQLSYLVEKDILTVFWSVSTMDWDPERNSTEEMLKRFEQGLHPGAIILLHDVDFNNTTAEKLTAVEQMIKKALKEGYSFVTTSEIINSKK